MPVARLGGHRAAVCQVRFAPFSLGQWREERDGGEEKEEAATRSTNTSTTDTSLSSSSTHSSSYGLITCSNDCTILLRRLTRTAAGTSESAAKPFVAEGLLSDEESEETRAPSISSETAESERGEPSSSRQSANVDGRRRRAARRSRRRRRRKNKKRGKNSATSRMDRSDIARSVRIDQEELLRIDHGSKVNWMCASSSGSLFVADTGRDISLYSGFGR